MHLFLSLHVPDPALGRHLSPTRASETPKRDTNTKEVRMVNIKERNRREELNGGGVNERQQVDDGRERWPA